MIYYLAPMEGVTGRIFRNAYDACFPSMNKYFAPFITPNDNGVLSPRDYKELDRENNPGLFLVPQILTNHADGFIRTARYLKEMGFTEVNINLGCPSGTVVSKKRGAGFLAYPEDLDRFLDEIFSGTDMEISVKTRIGMEREEEFAPLLDIYNRYPLKELIIHPRVRKDFYNNKPRIHIFQEGFLHSRNPVCYNGDIFTIDDYNRLRREFPTMERIMLGRGIIRNPGLLMEITDGCPVTKKKLFAFHQSVYLGYQKLLLSSSGERVVLFKMKELWSYMIASFPDSKRCEKKIKKSVSLESYEEAVSMLFYESEN